MENKINIAELLKDCPRGMELDCTMYDRVTFDEVTTVIGFDDKKRVKIILSTHYSDGTKDEIILTEFGTYTDDETAKCVIFPKGKTTWKGFVSPIKFKNGDIVISSLGGIHILKNSTTSYCYLDRLGLLDKSETTCVRVMRLATEEEKQKLFDTIKANGYRWNAETKTLEVINLKFHEGQWITKGYVGGQITSIDYNCSCYRIADFMGGIDTSIPFMVQDNYHLWTIQDAKDGDVICYSNGWTCIFKYIHGIWYSSYCFITSDGEFHTGCERHAVNSTINGNAHPATKEQCSLFFQKIKEAGYKWNPETKTLEKLPKFKVGDKVKYKNTNICKCIKKYHDILNYYVTSDDNIIKLEKQNDWELVPNKFDINTLVPFESKVLVRDDSCYEWEADIFGRYSDGYITLGGGKWKCCIPYEGNEHLLGTTNDCDDFYKTWEK